MTKVKVIIKAPKKIKVKKVILKTPKTKKEKIKIGGDKLLTRK